MKTKIFHNPRCSKSRLALSLLQKSQIEIEIIEYLKKPPSYQDILNILKMLNIKPIDLIRKREVLFKELELEKYIDDNHMLVEAMVNNPILIERPIIISGNRAVIGRPPELVLNII